MFKKTTDLKFLSSVLAIAGAWAICSEELGSSRFPIFAVFLLMAAVAEVVENELEKVRNKLGLERDTNVVPGTQRWMYRTAFTIVLGAAVIIQLANLVAGRIHQ